jgi:hypothetical protein
VCRLREVYWAVLILLCKCLTSRCFRRRRGRPTGLAEQDLGFFQPLGAGPGLSWRHPALGHPGLGSGALALTAPPLLPRAQGIEMQALMQEGTRTTTASLPSSSPKLAAGWAPGIVRRAQPLLHAMLVDLDTFSILGRLQR